MAFEEPAQCPTRQTRSTTSPHRSQPPSLPVGTQSGACSFRPGCDDAPMELELAWAVGFFDGEGSITLARQRYVTCSATQIRIEPLERLQAALGLGRLYPVDGRGAFHWITTYDAEGRAALKLLLPHLSAPKREQAEKVLAAADAQAPIRSYRRRSDTGANGSLMDTRRCS